MIPEEVVEIQLAAYNAHDIDAFMATYSSNIQLLKFPSGEVTTQGAEAMRAGYARYFERYAPHVEITKRIVTGNLVVDEETGRDNEGTFKAVAIYEVADDLIQRVWFLANIGS